MLKKLTCVSAMIFALWSGKALAADVDEMLATFINLKGYLCAKVEKVSPLAQRDTYEVRCIEYRGGSGTVDYIVNVKSGEVVKR